MSQSDNIIRIYSGHEVDVLFLKAELEENGIGAMVQNDFQSGVIAGFAGGLPGSIDLFVQVSDQEKAKPIVDEFIEGLKNN
jgi:hypothetical protein